jgi:hypothetical protein
MISISPKEVCFSLKKMKFLTIVIILILKLVSILACSKSIGSICCNPKGYDKCCCLDEDGKIITVRQATGAIRGFRPHGSILTEITEKMDCHGCKVGFNC